MKDIFSSLRIGQGYDIHGLVDNRSLILGGVSIPYHQGLAGHSDADVLIHAIIDSLLGASGNGDIGKNFPDTDNQYKNANSMELLTKILDILTQQNWSIINIDATIIAEKPKLANYITDITHNLNKIFNFPDLSRINIKAKTNEKFGYLGEGKAISVYANCLIIKNP